MEPTPDDPYAELRQALEAVLRRRRGADPRALLTALDRIAERGEEPAELLDAMRLLVENQIAVQDRDYATLLLMPGRFEEMLARVGPDAPYAGALRAAAGVARAMGRFAAADPDVVPALADELRATVAALGEHEPTRAYLELLDHRVGLARKAYAAELGSDGPGSDGPGSDGPGSDGPGSDGPGGRPGDDEINRLRRFAALNPSIGPVEQAVIFADVAQLLMAQVADRPHLATAAIRDLRTALRIAPPDDPDRVRFRALLGNALLRRAEAALAASTTGRALAIRPALRPRVAARRDVDQALTLLDQVVTEAEETHHPHRAWAGMTLADGYRRAGRHAEARAAGLRALRGHAWQVLLQSHAVAAATAGVFAPEDALRIARWCIADGDAEGAVTALDAGRGLILHAATETDDVPARLVAAGAPELAARWPGGPDAVPDADGQPVGPAPVELRRAAFARLTLDGTLLDPPSPDEIRAALRDAGFDALVYLVPGAPAEPASLVTGAAAEPARPGAAVVVDVDGSTTIHPLPELTAPPYPARLPSAAAVGTAGAAGPGGVIGPGAAARAGGERDLSSPRPRPPDELERLCGWAWRVAVGPLLDTLPSRPDAPPSRLVLVPMGELAEVPWHAARHPDGGYATQRAVFSYAASARMLCHAAAVTGARPAPPAAAGAEVGPVLIVGDPDPAGTAADLAGARREALALRDTYPGARYVGRLADGAPSPEGTGTPEEVLAFSGSVLHLACHGVVRDGWGADDTSYLVLAGGRRLAAERLIAARGARRPAVVVLAACSSSVSGRGWDEAFSLTTAFLAGGSGAVVAARWSVPDEETAALMLSFHRHLRAGHPPVDALRAAQLDQIQTGTAALRAWAAFTHSGR
ncbi:CHAT domain-containing protein [Micromonospora sp. WMMD882]|uniref:CHAT domain-containing protein n=1 Tax=Micromonospora sp. WMMD882 TaxID=3015151 RepID=UPI00248A923C|nr:CHAT domain-containing protein [Micromonospora sp. WMMD882]WBB79565.1 CHAT domain-containing protein [Micromonospora sp. WMMD882]